MVIPHRTLIEEGQEAPSPASLRTTRSMLQLHWDGFAWTLDVIPGLLVEWASEIRKLESLKTRRVSECQR